MDGDPFVRGTKCQAASRMGSEADMYPSSPFDNTVLISAPQIADSECELLSTLPSNPSLIPSEEPNQPMKAGDVDTLAPYSGQPLDPNPIKLDEEIGRPERGREQDVLDLKPPGRTERESVEQDESDLKPPPTPPRESRGMLAERKRPVDPVEVEDHGGGDVDDEEEYYGPGPRKARALEPRVSNQSRATGPASSGSTSKDKITRTYAEGVQHLIRRAKAPFTHTGQWRELEVEVDEQLSQQGLRRNNKGEYFRLLAQKLFGSALERDGAWYVHMKSPKARRRFLRIMVYQLSGQQWAPTDQEIERLYSRHVGNRGDNAHFEWDSDYAGSIPELNRDRFELPVHIPHPEDPSLPDELRGQPV